MDQTTSLIQPSPYVGIFLLLILGTLALPFPEDTTLMLSGLLMAHDIIQSLPTLMIIYPTLLMTDFSLYWIGKKYGRRVIEHKIFHRIMSLNRLLRLEGKFRRYGIWVIFFGRHVLGIRAQIFLAAGVMRMPARKFLLADAFSALITMAIMIGIGYFGGSKIQILREDLTRMNHIIMFSVMLIFLGWSLSRYFRRKKMRLD
jgi:membrane protein DedA with SNARE-associated domain